MSRCDHAPYRVIRVNEKEFINTKLEALKKRRDRYIKRYKKGKNRLVNLAKAKTFSDTIKRVVRKEMRRKIQAKAKCPNPKTFWKMINELQGKFHKNPNVITHKGITYKEDKDIAEAFADFFINKVESLSDTPVLPCRLPKPTQPVVFNTNEVDSVLKSIKNKKTMGLDNLPQFIFNESRTVIAVHVEDLLNGFAANGLPLNLKNSKITALHKKEDKSLACNYRPIANLSALSKVYEKCLLNKLNIELADVGSNQHGFRSHHSTETALLTLQSYISGCLNKKTLQ